MSLPGDSPVGLRSTLLLHHIAVVSLFSSGDSVPIDSSDSDSSESDSSSSEDEEDSSGPLSPFFMEHPMFYTFIFKNHASFHLYSPRAPSYPVADCGDLRMPVGNYLVCSLGLKYYSRESWIFLVADAGNVCDDLTFLGAAPLYFNLS